MTDYAALVRGVNVGGKQMSMPQLKTLLEGLGCLHVTTYIQSGNAVFTADRDPAELAADMEQRIHEVMGLDVKVLLRSRDELAATVAQNPFIERNPDGNGLHVTFLAAVPEAALVAEIDPSVSSPDEFRIIGRDIYLHIPVSYGRSKLNNAFWERKLKVPATTRNWRTTLKLLELTSNLPAT